MTTSGTYYYQPSAGTGNLLLANPPFVFDSMDTNQPTTADGLSELTEDEFLRLSGNTFTGCSGLPIRICSYEDALRIARAAYHLGADLELEACCEWLEENDMLKRANHDLRAARRPKPPTLKEQALAILDDCSGRGIDAAHENALRRVLEALPE